MSDPTLLPQEENVKSARDFADQFRKDMRCNCDLDNWEPEKNTGHSWVCRIHRYAVGHFNAQFNGGRVEIRGVPGHDN